MELSPSGHVDTFARDHLPPFDTWPVLEFTTPELQYPDRLNAATEVIDVPAARWPDRVALRTPEGETWTYADLLARANQVARVLRDDVGLVPGNRVLLRAPNNPWTVAAWLGVLKAGGVVATTFTALRARELAPIVVKSQPTLALVDHRSVADVHELVDTVAPDLRVLTIGAAGPEDLIARASTHPEDFENVVTAADDVALFCPTSGSTGEPKICTHFHRDVLSIDHTFGRHILDLEPDDVVTCTAPFAFTFGLGMSVVFPLRAGASAFLVEGTPPVRLAELVAEHGVTVLATAPTAYHQILKAGAIQQLAGLRVGVSAGEHISLATWEHIRDEIGLRLVDGIGGTEVLHIFLSAAGDDIRPGTTGKVVPGYRAVVLDVDDQEVGPGVPGRLAIRGPVGCRYLADPRQRSYVINGWNVTGDTFVQDEDGYFTYCARTDNMIVSSGYNIGGPEVEAALNEHSDVVESMVVACPDPDRGSVVYAAVVLAPGVARDEEQVRVLQDHVKQTLAPYKYPRRIEFVDALPRNVSGKLQHFTLRQRLAEQNPV